MKSIELHDAPVGSEFCLWEEPLPDTEYIIGADIAKNLDASEKKQTSDHSTFCILKRLPMGVEQVGEGFLRCEVSFFGLILSAFGYMYNTAILNPERNIAEGVVAGLMMADYPQERWYMPPVSLSVAGAAQGRFFFSKNKGTQNQLITTTLDYLARGSIILRSKPLVNELASLQYSGTKDINTNGKDRTIALMMAVMVDSTTPPPLLGRIEKKAEMPRVPHGKDPELWKELHGVKEKREEGDFYFSGEAPEWEEAG